MKSLRAALVGSLLVCVLVPASASADYRRWYLNNGTDGIGDIAVNYGDNSQTPVVGDWDGNGTDTPGVYQTSTARWWLANGFNGSTQAYFQYGSPGFAPVVGDWDGNRTRTVGAIQLPNRWHLSNVNGPVVGSIALTFGGTGDVMLTGDWNGDGKETVGIYHRSNAQFWLSNHNTGACCDKVFVFGNVGDVPLVGDWNGDGIDTVGVFRSSASGARWFLNNQNDGSAPELSFYYGNPGDTPVTGDWNGDGKDTPGVVRTFASATASPPPPALPDHAILKEQGTSTFYYYEDWERNLYASAAVAEADGVDLGTAITLTSGQLAAIPRGEDITMGDVLAEGVLEITDPDADYELFGSSYEYYWSMPLDFYTDDERVLVFGAVKWFRGKKKRSIHRSQFAKGTALHPQKPVGCMWAKVKWGYPILGSFSLPTPSVGIGGASTEGDYAVKCRKSGDDYPPPIKLTGIAFAKNSLNSITIEACHSPTRADGPRHCAWKKVYYQPSKND